MFVSSIEIILYLIPTCVSVASITISKLPLVPGANLEPSIVSLSIVDAKSIVWVFPFLPFTLKFQAAISAKLSPLIDVLYLLHASPIKNDITEIIITINIVITFSFF